MSLKVLMTADTAGGVWVYAVSLCAGLAEADVSVLLVALGTPTPEQRAEAEALPNVQLLVRPSRLEWMEEPWHDLDELAVELVTLAHDYGCDLVHLNHLVHGHLDWPCPVVCAVHSCVWSWFDAVKGGPPPAEWNKYRSRVAQSLRAADHVVAPSHWMLEQAWRFYGPLRDASVIANGSAAPLGDPASVRTGVLAAGRVWDEAKNLAPLADLAPALTEPLAIAGPHRPPGAEGWAALESAAGYLGSLSQPELWARMREARLFAAPARYEPFGLGVLEAARSGCALVLGDIPTFRETWQGAASFVDPRRPDTWHQTLDSLLVDDVRRQRMAMAAQRRARTYTRARMADAHLQLYGQAAGADLELI